jgi:hypothetical protein
MKRKRKRNRRRRPRHQAPAPEVGIASKRGGLSATWHFHRLRQQLELRADLPALFPPPSSSQRRRAPTFLARPCPPPLSSLPASPAAQVAPPPQPPTHAPLSFALVRSTIFVDSVKEIEKEREREREGWRREDELRHSYLPALVFFDYLRGQFRECIPVKKDDMLNCPMLRSIGHPSLSLTLIIIGVERLPAQDLCLRCQKNDSFKTLFL